MMRNHLEALCHKNDGSFALAGSSLTGDVWDGALWYFNSWKHYQSIPNIDMVATPTSTGHSDVKWFNQSLLLVAADSGVLEAWSVVAPGNELECASSMDGCHDDMILCLGVSGDGGDASVISGGADGKICLWDVASNKLISYHKGHLGWVTGVDHNPHQPHIFISTGMMKSSLKLWDTRCTDPITTQFTAPDNIYCQSVSWCSSDDNIIGTGNASGFVHIHDIRSLHNPLKSHHIHSNTVHRICFSPVVKGLVSTVSDDHTVNIFHLPSESTVLTSSLHSDFVHGLSWKPESSSLLTCGWDGRLFEHEYNDELVLLLESIAEKETAEQDISEFDDINFDTTESDFDTTTKPSNGVEMSVEEQEQDIENVPESTLVVDETCCKKSKTISISNGCVDLHSC